jgi:hypothetical protein
MRRSITVLVAAAACVLWAAGPASAATTWVIQATPNPAGATSPELNAISCHSSANCVAVGWDRNATTDISQTLAEHWNGKTWKIQAPPSLPRSSNAQLWGVACPSARSCTAVGQITNSSDFQTALAEHWNGRAWTTQTVPNPVGAAAGSLLFGISCSSATSCTAVGYQLSSAWDPEPEPLAEHWNGRAWTAQATPIPSGSAAGSLQAVSCVSTTSCTAVGYAYGYADGTSTPGTLLVEHWNGRTWAVQDAPNPYKPGPRASSTLTGVSCTSARSCIAVGYFDPPSGPTDVSTRLLAEHWNGRTWAVQDAPLPAGTNKDMFNAVSCHSATACTAAGFTASDDSSATSTVAERWNGRTWTIARTPNPAGSPSNLLTGVSCVSSTACSAVGSSANDGTLAEHS